MKRVLLIDDDRDFCEILQEEFPRSGIRAVITKVVHNVEEAQSVLARELAHFDCVIVDLSLPKSVSDQKLSRDAGLKLIKLIRGIHRFTGTLVVMTSSCSFADGTTAFESGCDAYLCKTRDLKDLLDSISLCLTKNVMVMSSEMRHLFLPEEITAKEARLMDMLLADATWDQIANELGYKNVHAACSTADRLFDKLLTWHDVAIDGRGKKKRELAVQLWRWRHRSHERPGFFTGHIDKSEIRGDIHQGV